jgi:hypothetical protein
MSRQTEPEVTMKYLATAHLYNPTALHLGDNLYIANCGPSAHPSHRSNNGTELRRDQAHFCTTKCDYKAQLS